LEALKDIPSLVTLSLVGNPVQTKAHYRAFLIHKLPNLRVLDFRKVKKQERLEAEELFNSAEGATLSASFAAKKSDNTFVPGQESAASSSATAPSGVSKLTPEQRSKIRQAILNAKSDEELSRLEEALQKGKMPKQLM